MQSFAFAVAILLLGLGALLNTAVLAYFVWHTCRTFAPYRDPRRPLPRPRFAPAHR